MIIKRNQYKFISVTTATTLASLVLFSGCIQSKPPAGQWNETLINNIRILKALDANELATARQMLCDDSLDCITFILHSQHFTTNKNILFKQPGLRAAARYWPDKHLPIPSYYFHEVQSNTINSALSLVRLELERKKKESK